jgi:hypothetical protein
MPSFGIPQIEDSPTSDWILVAVPVLLVLVAILSVILLRARHSYWVAQERRKYLARPSQSAPGNENPPRTPPH